MANTISDAERAAYHEGLARARAMIVQMGGDPDRPTVQQAQIVASALLAPIAQLGLDGDETQDLIASAIELLASLRRETH
jgi:hypothetical protein